MFEYNKYIIKQLAWTCLLICFSLSCIAWLVRSLHYVDFIVNKGVNLTTFFYFASLVFPSLLWLLIPISVFIAGVVVYHRLNSDSELIIMKSSGISKMGLVKPIFYFAGFATLLTYLVGLYLVPLSYREFKDLQTFIRDNHISLLLQESVFLSPMKDFTFYIRQRDEGGALKGILVHDERAEGEATTYMAEQGKLVQSGQGPMIMLDNGIRQQKNERQDDFSLLYFDRYALDLNLFNTDKKGDRWREPTERFLPELFSPDDTTDIRLLNKLRAEGHHRLTWPLFNFIMALLSVFPFINRDFSRRGYVRMILFSVVMAVGVVMWGSFATNAAARAPHLIYVLYGTVIMGVMVGFIMNLYQRRFRIRRNLYKLAELLVRQWQRMVGWRS